jgi:hypothetical protein
LEDLELKDALDVEIEVLPFAEVVPKLNTNNSIRTQWMTVNITNPMTSPLAGARER